MLEKKNMPISIVIPTYNEAKNIAVLVAKIAKVLAKQNYEIIVVDDNSPDGTYSIAKELEAKYPLKAICRKNERGLASAVLAGFGATKGSILGVMDADLSHPPELIPELVNAIKNGADIAIGSRLIKGGKVEEWPSLRRFISAIARMLARPLTNIKDSMSGFFFLKRSVIENVKLVPRGYKILLEILVRGNYKKVKEVPYTFLSRHVGKSKIGLEVYLDYVAQLINLYFYKLTGK